MTAESSPLNPAHHRDRVYRSAERLIASRPNRSRWKLPTRWLIFLLGAACGSAITCLLLRPNPFSRSEPSIENPPPGSAATPLAAGVEGSQSGAHATRPEKKLELLLRYPTKFKLRGELRVTNGTKRNVEYELQLAPENFGGSVQGSMRFLDGPRPGRAIRVTGTFLTYTLCLRTSGEGDGLFYVDFPATNPADPISGYGKQGNLLGWLTLTPVPPR